METTNRTSATKRVPATGAENLLGKSPAQIAELVGRALDEPVYRGKQICNWMYRHNILDFHRMTNLNGGLQDRLSEHFVIHADRPETIQKSPDGTQKLLFRVGSDVWEAVLMSDGHRRTVCVSTQSGCGLGCRFCATATLGFQRNLTVAEIIAQILRTSELLPKNERLTNVVFMGMGEPLQNYGAVKAVLDLIGSTAGFEISIRKTTVSTVGLVPQIRQWARDRNKAHLAISLIAADDRLRSELMPINNRFPLAELKAAAIEVAEACNQRITFEYILMDGVNDSLDHARKLVTFIHGIPSKINLIRFHPHPESEFRRPQEDRVMAFRDYLYPRCPAVSIRKSFGVDIDAACGQLAGRSYV